MHPQKAPDRRQAQGAFSLVSVIGWHTRLNLETELAEVGRKLSSSRRNPLL
jgi:hypothetical protein